MNYKKRILIVVLAMMAVSIIFATSPKAMIPDFTNNNTLHQNAVVSEIAENGTIILTLSDDENIWSKW